MGRGIRGLVHLLFGIPIGAVTLVIANLVAGAPMGPLRDAAILGAFIGALMGFVWTWVMRRYGHRMPWYYHRLHSLVGAGSILRGVVWLVLASYGSTPTIENASPLHLLLFLIVNVAGSLVMGVVSYWITSYDKND